MRETKLVSLVQLHLCCHFYNSPSRIPVLKVTNFRSSFGKIPKIPVLELVGLVKTRKTHKTDFIITPLSAKSRSNLGQGQILGQGHGQGQCVWLHLASPDVSVDSADGSSSGLIR